MCNENGKSFIEGYINGNSSICREERQYALYLSNVLRYYGIENKDKYLKKLKEGEKENLKELFQKCGLDLETDIIENVFYEATFMRDIFEKNREDRYANKRFSNKKNWKWEESSLKGSLFFIQNDPLFSISFNYNLLAYCWKKVRSLDDKAFGGLFSGKILNNKKFEEKNYGGRVKIPLLKYQNDVEEIGHILSGKVSNKQTREKSENEKRKVLGEEKRKKLEELLSGKAENEKREVLDEYHIRTLVRAMMNAKPDLAVVYHKGYKKDIRFLLFIECKYESDEDNYAYLNYNNDNVYEIINISQREAQGNIAEFLCNRNSYLSDVKVSPIMGKNIPYKSNLIQFSQEKDMKGTDAINIASLISLDKKIFENQRNDEKE